MRRTRATDCRTLPFTPEQVYAALVDFQSYPRWGTPELRLRVLQATPDLVASRFEVRPRGGWFVCEVMQVVPAQEMLVRYVAGVHRGIGIWTLEPVAGGTRVCYAIDLEPHGWLPRLLSRFLDFGRMHSRAMAELLAGLEDRVRQRAAKAGA